MKGKLGITYLTLCSLRVIRDEPTGFTLLHLMGWSMNRIHNDYFLNLTPDTVYAEFDNKEILERTTGLKVNTHGANILIDIPNQSDTLPRFRFTSNLVIQYFYQICPIGGRCPISYYCWQTVNANPNIDLTGGVYSQGSSSIRKQTVCFLDDNLFCYALIYGVRYSEENSSNNLVSGVDYKSYMVHHRILYLKQYTLNNEA